MALFSAQAAVLVANVQSSDRAKRLSDGMRQAVHARDLVSMAKGVLMGSHAVDEDTAFGMLLARLRTGRHPVAETARAIVDSVVRTATLMAAPRPDTSLRAPRTPRLTAAFRRADLTIEELWTRYFALGGDAISSS